jgi:hypothetical protein
MRQFNQILCHPSTLTFSASGGEPKPDRIPTNMPHTNTPGQTLMNDMIEQGTSIIIYACHGLMDGSVVLSGPILVVRLCKLYLKRISPVLE